MGWDGGHQPDWSPTPIPVPYADFGDPQSLNLYGYVQNNPLSHVDPDGHATWYDPNGKKLGSDGVNDGGVTIQKASWVSYSPDHSIIDVAGSGTPMYSFSQAEGNAIQSSVDRTIAPGGNDRQGNMHEEGFTEDASGIHNKLPGPAYKPGDTTVHVNGTISSTTTMDEHTHPAGPPVAAGTFGGTQFDPKPSTGRGQDVPNARDQDGITHVEASAGNRTVYIYNGNGVQAQVPLDAFPKPDKQ